MPVLSAMNRNANWPVPKPSPYPISQRASTVGRGTQSVVGIAMTKAEHAREQGREIAEHRVDGEEVQAPQQCDASGT